MNIPSASLYKDCTSCGHVMTGIMDYSIRLICSECGGYAISENHIENTKENQKESKNVSE